MKTRFWSVFMCIVILISLMPAAIFAEGFPVSLEAPYNAGVTVTFESNKQIESYKIGFSYPAKILDTYKNRRSLLETSGYSNLDFGFEFDYKYNEGGNWHYTSAWDSTDLAPDPFHRKMNVMDTVDFTAYLKSKDFLPEVSDSRSMLDNNTVYFRFRATLRYKDTEGQSQVLISPWSDTKSVGKNAVNAELKLEAPVLAGAELKKNDLGAYIILVKYPVPDSIKAIDNGSGIIYVQEEFRLNNGEWSSISTNFNLDGDCYVNPKDINPTGAIDIEGGLYEMRARFAYNPEGGRINNWSPYSNIIKVTTPDFYKAASKWAAPELDKAADYGLIPDSLKGADMTKPITREEFAELAVRLYEKTTGIAAAAASPNPFTDTQNPEILKALKLGVTTGTSATTFEPLTTTNREQVAAMLSRTMRVMAPQGDYSTKGAPSFTDSKSISSWAMEHVLYMAKSEIIKGVDGKFMPKATTSVEIANNYAVTTREQAILMSVRAFEQLKP